MFVQQHVGMTCFVLYARFAVELTEVMQSIPVTTDTKTISVLACKLLFVLLTYNSCNVCTSVPDRLIQCAWQPIFLIVSWNNNGQ